VEHEWPEGALLDLLHLPLILVVRLTGGKELSVQHEDAKAEQVVRLGDVANEHRLVGVRLS